jgi:glycosyltransferase involved in cell wall biosynthesis
MSSFVRYLPEQGWAPTVVTTGELGVVFDDPTLLQSLPSDVRVLRWHTALAGTWALRRKSAAAPSGGDRPATGTARTSTMRRMRRFARSVIDSKVSVPDHAVAWGVATGVRLGYWMRSTDTRVLLTSSPPYSLLLTGMIASTIARASWIADLRDPWGNGDRRRRRTYRDRVGFTLESFAARHADFVLSNTPAHREYLLQLAPRRADRIVTMPNGYDADEVEAAKLSARPRAGFRIVHAGALYRGLREPSDILEAMARFRGARGGDDVRLELPGDSAFHHDPAFQERIASLGLSQSVEFPGYIPHAEVLQRMATADVLLLIQGGGFPMQVPSKAYEYVAMRRPILAVAPAGATAELVRKTPLGMVAEPGDIDGIVRCLERVRRGDLAAHDASPVPAKSRRELTAQLVPVLEAALRLTES